MNVRRRRCHTSLFLLTLWCMAMFLGTAEAAAVEINDLWLVPEDLPEGFYLKKGVTVVASDTGKEKIITVWETSPNEKTRTIVREERYPVEGNIVRGVVQEWYRRPGAGKKIDRVEIGVGLASSREKVNELVEGVRQMYAAPLTLCDKPLFGERMWNYPENTSAQPSWAFLFARGNAVVRVYACIPSLKLEDMEKIISTIAAKIDAKLKADGP